MSYAGPEAFYCIVIRQLGTLKPGYYIFFRLDLSVTVYAQVLGVGNLKG